MFTILLLSESRNRNIPYWRLELDQWMGAVVTIDRQCFTLGAEISIVADGTFIAITSDVMLGVLAQWPVTIDAIVDRGPMAGERNGLIERDKSMAWVACSSTFDAG